MLLGPLAFANPFASVKSKTTERGMHGSCSVSRAPECDQGPRTTSDDMYCASAVIDAMNRTFQYASLGHSHYEYAFFVKRLPDGTWVATEVQGSNGFNSVTVKWDPAALAFGHIHPNHTDGRPSENDMQKADGRRPAMPFFVFGSGGLWEYDPAKRRSTENPRLLRENLDWSRACRDTTSAASVDRASGKAR